MSEPVSADPVVELQSLVGEHTLTGVDFSKVAAEVYEWNDPEICVFVLDGQVFTARESPDDGYRSSMRDVRRGGPPVANTFEPCRVLCSIRTKGEYSGKDEVLEMRDLKTGRVVLEFGTSNIDDYYPSWEAHFDPTAMAANS